MISEHASLRAIDENKDLVKMFYADFSLCPFDKGYEQVIADGAVDVTIYKPGIELKDSEEFQRQEPEYAANNPAIIADVQPIEVNGYKGVGWEPYENYSITMQDGKEISRTSIGLSPGVVRYYNEDDGTIYNITAQLPLAEIIEIAESIQ